MSNILKGIINEVNSHDYDSDWDYQDAVARSGKSRSGYRSQEDDTSDADIAYSKKMYQLAQKQKRDADHDRLASGTNEDITETSNPYEPVMIQGYDKWLKLVNIPNVDKHAYKSDITAVTSLGDIIGEFNTDKDLGYVIKKYVKKGMSEAGTGLDIDRSIPGRTIARISGDIKHRTGSPSGKKLPDYHPDDDYDQWSGKVGPSIHDDEEDTFDTDYTGDEDGPLKEISNEKLGQYKTAAALDAGKADKEGDYKRGDKRFSGIVKATKKQFANDTKQSAISQGVSEEFRPTTSQAMNIRKQTTKKMNPGTSKLVWKRPNQISGSHSENELKSLNFKYSTKYNMWGGTQDMWNRLTGALDENVGDHLKSTALDVLVKTKLEIERQREVIEKQHEAEGEAYKQDLIKNNASRLPKQNIKTFQPIPVVKPDENPDVLRDRLQHLDIAKQKFQKLNELVDAIRNTYQHHIVTTKMDELDKSLLQYVKDGPADNYKSLLIKLTELVSNLAGQYPTAVAYLAKKNKQGVDEDNNSGRMRMKDYYELADAIQEKLRQAIKMGDTIRMQELNKQRDELDARVKKHGMMPESVDEADMNRRGFLGKAGAGALAAAGLGGASNAQAFKGTLPAPRISGNEAEAQIAELRSTTYKELASMMWNAWPRILDTTFGANTPQDRPATPEQIGKILGYRLAEYADEYRQKVRAIKLAAGVRDPQSLNKTTASVYVNEQEIDEEQLDELSCWSGYHRVAGTKAGFPGSCAKNKTNEEQHSESCPHCGGEMVSEELMNEKKDACYYKVKSRYKVWPSAYASGALVKCRNKGASNWGNSSKNESSILEGINRADESLHDWFNKEKWVRMDTKGKIKGPCAREPGEGKPKCLPQSKAHSLGKKGRASAAQRKRREDPNPDRSGKAINVDTKKKD